MRVIEDELETLRSEVTELRDRWQKARATISAVQSLKERQEKLRTEQEDAGRRGDLERAAQIRYGELVELEKQLEEATRRLEEQPSDSSLLRGEVDEEDIARIVAKWTGIPVTRMLEGEIQKLVHMEDRLRERVIGQDEALAHISNAVRRNRAGLSDPSHPIGTFVFLGPTGGRQNGAGAGVGRVSLRRRKGDGAYRHVRVHGEARRLADDRSASRLCGLRGGRPVDRACA